MVQTRRNPATTAPKAKVTFCVQGVISPMLSNIFLHHVLDEWFEREAKPRLRGSCQLVRFADDFVMAFEDARSGRRMLDVLGKRLGRYGLTLHETKTRYVDFRPKRPRAHDPDTTFDFLGFTHVWGRSRRGSDRRSPDHRQGSLHPRAQGGARVVQGQSASSAR